MTDLAHHIEDDEDAAEAHALAAAIAESDADPRTTPHEEVLAWLLRIANGEFDARRLSQAERCRLFGVPSHWPMSAGSSAISRLTTRSQPNGSGASF